MFRAATLSKRSFIEEAVKCLLRELINAGHSIRMCLTATASSSAQSVDKEDDIQPSLPAANVSGGMCYLYISILHNNIKLFDELKLS